MGCVVRRTVRQTVFFAVRVKDHHTGTIHRFCRLVMQPAIVSWCRIIGKLVYDHGRRWVVVLVVEKALYLSLSLLSAGTTTRTEGASSPASVAPQKGQVQNVPQPSTLTSKRATERFFGSASWRASCYGASQETAERTCTVEWHSDLSTLPDLLNERTEPRIAATVVRAEDLLFDLA